MSNPFAAVAGASKKSTVGKTSAAAGAVAETIVVPVPPTAPAPPSHLPKLGKPSAVWPYYDAAGGLLGYVHRYDGPDGKQFRPLTLWRSGAGVLKWNFKSWPELRPVIRPPAVG